MRYILDTNAVSTFMRGEARVAARAVAITGTLVTANVEQMVRVTGLTVEDWAEGQ